MQLRAITAACLLLGVTALASNGGVPVRGAETTLSSSQLKAGIVAYNDFAAKIGAQSGGPPELVAYVSNIGNYSVAISEDETYYVILFSLKPLAGERLKGGGARYLISKAAFKIEKVVRFK